MSRSRIDAAVDWLLRSVSLGTCTLVGLVFCFLVVNSLPAISALGMRMITDPDWQPTGPAEEAGFGLLPILAGSLAVMTGAIILAAPLGLASAVFCRFYAPRFVATGYRRLVELLAGIPSVVFGFWGLVVLVPLVNQIQAPGASLLAGILIVGLMILPTTMLVMEASLQAVPESFIQAAASLGMGRQSIVVNVVFPTARAGILTAITLGAARAIGETMAVVMVCGNVVQLPTSLFDPVRTLTANIALEMGYALAIHRSALFCSGLALLVIAMTLVAAIEVSRVRLRRGAT